MQFKELLADDDAVSPVIGVILMVAITVILAAVIGTFVLGLGDQVQSTPPNAQFTTEYDNGAQELTFTHDGGEQIDQPRLDLTTDGAEICANEGNTTTGCSTNVTTVDLEEPSAWISGDSVSAGDSAGVYAGNDGGLDTATVRLIWTSEGGDNSDTLRRWEGPDA